jgi:hypothetical protein
MCVCVCVCVCVYPYTKLHVNEKLTINTVQVAPHSFGTSGGIGDRTICWNGTPSSHPFSLGIDNMVFCT